MEIVHTPKNHDKNTHKYPVLYLLDDTHLLPDGYIIFLSQIII